MLIVVSMFIERKFTGSFTWSHISSVILLNTSSYRLTCIIQCRLILAPFIYSVKWGCILDTCSICFFQRRLNQYVSEVAQMKTWYAILQKKIHFLKIPCHFWIPVFIDDKHLLPHPCPYFNCQQETHVLLFLFVLFF